MGKRLFVMALLLLVVISLVAQPVLGVAQVGGATWPLLLQALAPLLAAIATTLSVRLFRKMGIEIEESTIEPILTRIIEIIANVEAQKKHLTGAQKKEEVASIVRNVIPHHEQQLLVKKYGSLETAVQAAFERSSVSKKSSVRPVVK